MDELERELEILSPEQRELLELLLDESSPGPLARDPASETETAVAQAFASVLGAASVDIDADFLELGGDSLKAIRLLTALRARFDVTLSLGVLYGAHARVTVRRIAAHIETLVTRSPGARDRAPALIPDRDAEHAAFPLTDVQQAYWFGRSSDFELSGVSTHVYEELECEDLDVARLERAFERLIERHPMLRARIAGPGEQRVEPRTRRFEIPVLDVENDDAATRAARLQALRDQMSHAVLPADDPPLVEMRAARLDARRTRLCVSLDALFCDAFSVNILFGELEELYRDPNAQLPELGLTFRDYVVAARAMEDTPDYAASLAYWRERVETLPPGPELPLADAPPTQVAPRFRRRKGRLAPARWSAFKARAARAGVTPSCALLAAFAETLARFSKRQRFSLNLTLFNRMPLHPDVDRVVGDFTSLTLLDVDARQTLAFEHRARTVQEQLWRDLDHRAVSGVRVLRDLARRDPSGKNALMPVVFTSTLNPGGAGDATTTSWAAAMSFLGSNGYGITQTPQVWLDHQVAEDHGALAYTWDSVEDLFRPGVLDALWAAYSLLLEELATAPDWSAPARVGLPDEQLALFERTNATDAPLPTGLLHQPFQARVWRDPDASAVLTSERTLSYAELDRRSDALALALLELGARPNALVAVLLHKGWEQIVACLGVSKSGAAYLPLDPALPRERLDDVFAQAPVIAIVTSTELVDGLDCASAAPRLAVDALPPRAERPPPSAAVPTDLAYVIFTSGSTGKPKGVMIDHRGALNTVLDVNARFEVGPGDRVLSLSALSFDLSVYDVFGLLGAGGAVVLPDRERQRDPAHWLELIRGFDVTLWNSVPALMEMLVCHAGDGAGALPLRLVLLSGDWIPVSLPERVRALSAARVVSLGGATEASIWSIAYPIDEVEASWKSIPYGTALANQRMFVLNSRFEPCPVWVVGDLYIGGVGVALGYFGDAERTSERFVVNPHTGERLYSTGDLGRVLPDGNIEFLGREDLQVKIQGYRIELEDVEAALARLPALSAACVFAAASRSGGKRLVAGVVPRVPADFDVESAKRALAARLPSYMLPSQWLVLDALPLTTNGKIDRRALLQGAETPSSRPASPPDDDRHAPFLAVARELFRTAALDRTQSFFALGGDSLLAARLIAKLRELHGVELPMRVLFEAPTFDDVLEQIAERLPAAPRERAPDPAPGDAEEPFRLTDVQYAYWLGRAQRFGLGGVACQAYIEIDATDLDVARLDRAFRTLVARHPMLRAVVRPDGLQVVLREAHEPGVPVLDLRAFPEHEKRARLERERRERSHALLPLDRCPILRLCVTRIDDATSRVHLNVDLVVMDYWSFLIFCRELRVAYLEPERPLPALGVDFAACVARARREEQDDRGRSLEYWRERAKVLPPAPQLPLAADPTALTAPRFERRKTRLALRAELRQRAEREGLTPSALVLAAFAEVLGGFARSPAFTLNVTLFDRPSFHADVEHVIGDFTTLTLLGVDGSAPTFRARAHAVQQQLWRDLDHRRVSGVRVLAEMTKQRGAPVRMPVVFTSTLSNAEAPEPPLAWLGEEAFSVSQTPQVWLDHQVSEDRDGLILVWDAAGELFPPGLLDAMFEAYVALVRRVCLDDAAFELPPPVAATTESSARPLGIEPDPARRLAFKLEKRGLRRDLETPALGFPKHQLDADRIAAYVRRRTHRSFVTAPVAFEKLAALLGFLALEKLPGMPLPKARYASAGGLYPVQLYLHAKRGRCEALPEGCYYYHPERHALAPISNYSINSTSYAIVNRAAFESAAFAIYLVFDRSAIEPLYAEHSEKFALLEAGIMTHLLETAASELGLGLCQTGALAFESLRQGFALGPDHVFLHALVGGAVADDAHTLAALVAEHRAVSAMLELARPAPRFEAAHPPRAFEREVAAAWAELLDGATHDRSASFFEAGGTSLGVVELSRALRARLGVEVPVLALFEHTTIAAQAEYLRSLSEPGPEEAPATGGTTRPEPDVRRRERLRRGRAVLE